MTMRDGGPNAEDERKKGKAEKAQPGEEEQPGHQKGEESPTGPDGYPELKDRFLRLAAEFDNYKKRTQKDMQEAKELGKAETLRSMLNIVDEFDLMLATAVESQDKGLAKGVELLYANFMDALRKNGLKEIDAVGRFDPYRHEIMMVREEDGKEDGHILEVIKKGYALNDRLLRAASVIVAKPKSAGAEDGKGGRSEKE